MFDISLFDYLSYPTGKRKIGTSETVMLDLHILKSYPFPEPQT